MKKPFTILTRSQIIGLVMLVLLLGAAYGIVWFFRPAPTVQQPRLLQSFDPNTADSITLISLGFKPFQTRAMLNYRRHYGRYRTPDDLRRVPGMSDTLFATLQPYIAIDTMPFHLERIERQRYYDSLHVERQREYDSLRIRRRDSLYTVYQAIHDSARRSDSVWWDSIYQTDPRMRTFPRIAKKDTILDLNTADTTELQLIRGIGSYTARAIVGYRKDLGGYVSPLQLKELAARSPLLASLDTLTASFVATSDSVKPIIVNHASVRRLANHPYLTFSQAKAIYELRHRRMRLRSIDDLRSLILFSDSDIVRLTPYLSFDR